MEINWWIVVGTLGPLGLIGFVRASIIAYNDWKAAREPRLTLAPRERVEELESTFVELMPRVFGFDYDDCFITDESSLCHFGGAEYRADVAERMLAEYSIDIHSLPDDLLVTIAAAIRRRTSE